MENNSVKTPKVGFISYAYAIGAILVILGHSTPTGVSDLPCYVDDIRTFIYCFHMPLFFLIAGVLFGYTTLYKGLKPYSEFMKGKVTKFLIPYFTFTILGFFPKIILANFVNDDVSFDFPYIVKIIFNPRESVWGHFWFMPTLLMMYAISYLLLLCTKNKLVSAIVLASVFALAVFPFRTNWFALNDYSLQLVYFYIGIVFSNFIINNRQKVLRFSVGLITTSVAVVLFYYVLIYGLWRYPVIKTSSSIVIALLMMYTVLSVSYLFEKKGCKILKALFGKTFTIYLLSWPCQAAIEVMLNRVLNLPWFITVAGMFIVGIGIPMIIIFIYDKNGHKSKIINAVLGC